MAATKSKSKAKEQEREEVELEVEETATDEATNDATEAEGGDSGEGKRARRPGPSYGLQKLDSLPDNAKIERQSRQVYIELLQPIVEDEDNWGEWFQVAEFNTMNGAKDAAKAIKAGTRDVPDGEWEFEYRRLKRDNGDRYSILAARYLGN